MKQIHITVTKKTLKDWFFARRLHNLLNDMLKRNGNPGTIIDARITVGDTTWHYRLGT